MPVGSPILSVFLRIDESILRCLKLSLISLSSFLRYMITRIAEAAWLMIVAHAAPATPMSVKPTKRTSRIMFTTQLTIRK